MTKEQEQEMLDYIATAKTEGYPGTIPDQLTGHAQIIEYHGRVWEWYNLQKWPNKSHLRYSNVIHG
nr:hypothetical protein [Providencia alcalifaciens]